MKFFDHPRIDYITIILVGVALGLDIMIPAAKPLLVVAALLGGIPTFWSGITSIIERRITIDTFNMLALGVSLGTYEFRSAAFIVLMLASAGILDWYTASRTRRAMEELLKLKPEKAIRERDNVTEEISIDAVREGDVLLVANGGRIPTDGTVIFGSATVNEAMVTGESLPVEKIIGEKVLGGTINVSGVIKIRATHVGSDSLIEQMATLMREAAKNKSHPEKLADRFAAIFLPVVIGAGALTYFVTHNISMTVALFLVACADDMAVAIPLAMTAAIGKAAQRGVLVKGGEWFDALSKVETLVVDKTGTLTYGSFGLRKVEIEEGIDEKDFWRWAGIAEKFSEHPVGRAIFREALAHVSQSDIVDPDEAKVYRGNGIVVKTGSDSIALGDEGLFTELADPLTQEIVSRMEQLKNTEGGTVISLMHNKKFTGFICIADMPRKEARTSLEELRRVGVKRIVMLTGDNEQTAASVARGLGITEYKSSVTPEDKLREIEELHAKHGIVAMVGDGINDSPALVRADVGIAMGSGGAAVAVEAADVVILTDNLDRIPETILLGKRTISVIHSDMVLWFLSNAIGFALVLTGAMGPALAAFYNFATDFVPLINSARLFRKR